MKCVPLNLSWRTDCGDGVQFYNILVYISGNGDNTECSTQYFNGTTGATLDAMQLPTCRKISDIDSLIKSSQYCMASGFWGQLTQ